MTFDLTQFTAGQHAYLGRHLEYIFDLSGYIGQVLIEPGRVPVREKSLFESLSHFHAPLCQTCHFFVTEFHLWFVRLVYRLDW